MSNKGFILIAKSIPRNMNVNKFLKEGKYFFPTISHSFSHGQTGLKMLLGKVSAEKENSLQKK